MNNKYKLTILSVLGIVLTHYPNIASPYANGSFKVKTDDKRAVFLTLGEGKESKKEFVLRILHGEVYGNGLVLDDKKMLLQDTINQWPGSTIDDLPLRKRDNFILERIDCSVAVLGNSGQDNYYHWLFQILPRVHLLRLGEFKCDKYYFESELSLPFQHETLSILGINEKDLLYSKEDTIFRVKELLVPSISTIPAKHGEFAFKGWVIPWLNCTILGDCNQKADKLLYISRADAKFRRINNEKELISSLKKYGFEVIELSNLTVKEQAKLFNSAKLIIAQHGAGLANLAFAQKGVTLIEINDKPPFKSLANVIGGLHIAFRKTFTIVNEASKTRLLSLGIPENKFHDFYDIEVNIDELTKLVRSKNLTPSNQR